MALQPFQLESLEREQPLDESGLGAARQALARYFGMPADDLMGRLRIDDVAQRVCLMDNSGRRVIKQVAPQDLLGVLMPVRTRVRTLSIRG